jgi:hypothetical protein
LRSVNLAGKICVTVLQFIRESELIFVKERRGWRRKHRATENHLEPTMPASDIAFLVLVAGSMIVFAATLAVTSWYSS